MPQRDSQQNLSRAGRLTPPLFPILQRVRADAQDGRKFGLRQAELAAHLHDVGARIDLERARGLEFALRNGLRLLCAFEQYSQQLLFDGTRWFLLRMVCLPLIFASFLRAKPLRSGLGCTSDLVDS